MSADHKQIAYKWISRTLTSDKEIKVLEEKLLRLETDINNCVKPMEKSEVQNGSSSNSQEIKLAEYSDLRNEIQTRIAILQEDDMKVLYADTSQTEDVRSADKSQNVVGDHCESRWCHLHD